MSSMLMRTAAADICCDDNHSKNACWSDVINLSGSNIQGTSTQGASDRGPQVW